MFFHLTKDAGGLRHLFVCLAKNNYVCFMLSFFFSLLHSFDLFK